MKETFWRLALAGICLSIGSGFFVDASAARYSSASYVIDASVMGNSFGGDTSSSSYKLTSSGGEGIVGDGASGSYKMTAGYAAQLYKDTPTLQLKTQPNGLVAYYPFDENTGTVGYDNSINTNDATLQASTTWVAGKIGSGISPNSSTTGDVRVPDNSALPSGQHLTLEIWAKQTSSDLNRAIASHWDYTGNQPVSGSWALQTANTDATRLRFYIATTSGEPGDNYVDTPVGSWSTGGWHHIVVAYDGTLAESNRAKIYIDGVQQTTTIGGTISPSLQNAASYLDIGDFRGLDRPWNGSLDQVKVFNRTLGLDEVKAEYDAQAGGTESGLTLSTIMPGVSNSSDFDVITTTSASGYNLAINQNHDLQSGSYTIPPVGGSIASPLTWSEGNTKGLGFSLVSTNATAIPGKWGSGAAFAAITNSSTTFYSRTGAQSSKDVLGMRLRADVGTSQASTAGSYTNTLTITATTLP